MGAIFFKALGFLPSWVPFAAVGILLAGLTAGGFALKAAWENEGAARVTLAVEQQANETLRQSLANREAFEAEVRKGFQDLSTKVGGLQATNTTFKAQVKSDATSSAPLSDSDRSALCGLFGASATGCPGAAR